MRVGLVVENFDPRRGGVEHWTYQFAHRVLAAGHEVHIVAARFASGVEQLGIVAHRLEPPRSKLDFARAAERKLRTLALDVIHDTGCGWYCDVFQPHGGSRVAAFEQNLLLAASWVRPIKRRLAAWLPRYRDFEELARRQYADGQRIFLAISKMVAGHLQRYHGVASQQLRLIYNGVDLQRFSPRHRQRWRDEVRSRLAVGDDETVLLIVAHNFRLKGVPAAIEATAQLAAQGHAVRLIVAGGKRHARYERLAARLQAARRVSFVGAVDDAVPYYAAADVYVQPTFYDPCSLVVLEALASGLPVVTSRFNGAGEIIRPDVEGYVIDDPADAMELAAAVRPLLDRRRAEQMGQAARRLAAAHSLERNCAEVLRLYEEVAARSRRAA